MAAKSAHDNVGDVLSLWHRYIRVNAQFIGYTLFNTSCKSDFSPRLATVPGRLCHTA